MHYKLLKSTKGFITFKCVNFFLVLWNVLINVMCDQKQFLLESVHMILV